eukprot:TRINITY_DN27717_c0_g2_i1.p1 TRINITY_DN27717_c0_g2~~TRINITY_DN27717_c0_g2_i1.p1  ORF type:complete len:140 (+),score=19.62 TRINITY_DN27717_c0_g2_i1:59-478(+)
MAAWARYGLSWQVQSFGRVHCLGRRFPVRVRISRVASASSSEVEACLKVFGLQPGASTADIHQRYLTLAKELHPDVADKKAAQSHGSHASKTDSDAADECAFQGLQRCYQILRTNGSAKKETPEWLKQMKKDFANYPAC